MTNRVDQHVAGQAGMTMPGVVVLSERDRTRARALYLDMPSSRGAAAQGAGAPLSPRTAAEQYEASIGWRGSSQLIHRCQWLSWDEEP